MRYLITFQRAIPTFYIFCHVQSEILCTISAPDEPPIKITFFEVVSFDTMRIKLFRLHRSVLSVTLLLVSHRWFSKITSELGATRAHASLNLFIKGTRPSLLLVSIELAPSDVLLLLIVPCSITTPKLLSLQCGAGSMYFKLLGEGVVLPYILSVN